MQQQTTDQWNANLYDIKHSFVSSYGNFLIDLLAPKSGEKILDLGCGTGDLTKKLNELGAEVIGVDKSTNMVSAAMKKYPEIPFRVADATDLPFKDEFDAVFSNATLHWVQEPKKALESIYASLREKGRFVAEFGGKGNVQTIAQEMIDQLQHAGLGYEKEKNPWYYPSIAEYSTLMEEVGFRVTFAQHIDRPTPLEGEDGLRNWMDMFGNAFFQGITEEQKKFIQARVEENLRSKLYQDGKWVADYIRIRVIGVKE
ncbi:class I SAM-dependent methyltransferase [Bacillus dakarensis]|uniref:class I SAM-dependent methyltransferase n=1 Tax=Robertmurraya dakarensis TaxID=1926278 RepID=UPI0011159FB4|nr:class I SAM-dependent methyltransferase [Bacillus dakarensis]